MMLLRYVASCDDCDWCIDGDPVTVDRAAEKHTKTAKHSTVSRCFPVDQQQIPGHARRHGKADVP